MNDRQLLRIFGGPVLLVNGREADLGTGVQRRVLAALALDVGSVIPPDVLAERVWDGAPPPSARGSLQAHLTRVREVLRRAEASMVVRRRSGGYVLDADPESVDLSLVRSLRRRAEQPGVGPVERAALLEGAVGLWVGPALAGISGSWAQRVRASLDRELLDTVMDWARQVLELGDHGPAVARLRTVHERFPRVEPVVGLLMRALHLAGRDSEAIEVYLSLRHRLVEDLGTEPGPALSAIYQALLRGELEGPPIGGGPPFGGGPAPGGAPEPFESPDVPRQLPPAVSAFTGRRRELTLLDSWLEHGNGAGTSTGTSRRAPGRSLVISAVSGTAGVGKTALAVHWAHGVSERFPDGQLYLNLRGYDREHPLSPADALTRMLQGMGVPGPAIPAEVDQRTALFRTLTAERQMLIVLDNASSDGQVRPLLPGSGGCVVVITSRDPLAGLVARDGARRLALDVLEDQAAVELLRSLIGPAADADPQAVEDLARRCQRLPLALRVAAERVVTSWDGSSLRDLIADLDAAQQPLDLLEVAGDETAAVRAAFSWSYRYLPADVARTFRLLGAAPVRVTDVLSAAALAGLDPVAARRHLDVLARAGLLQPSPLPGYLGMHDLLRAYAVELADQHDGPEAIRQAQQRFLDSYLATATAAMDQADPHDRPLRLAFGAPVSAAAAFDAEGAVRWLDSQQAILTEVITLACRRSPDHALALAATVYRRLRQRAASAEIIEVFGQVLELARAAARPGATVLALSMVSFGLSSAGDRETALRYSDEALEAAAAGGDPFLQAHTLLASAWLAGAGTSAEKLREQAQAALDFAQGSGDGVQEIIALNYLAIFSHTPQGAAAGLEQLRMTLAVAERVGDLFCLVMTLTNLAEFEGSYGDVAAAIRYLDRALELARRLGSPIAEVEIIANLAAHLFRSGDLEASLRNSRHAIRHARRFGDARIEAYAMVTLGDVLRASGRTKAAAGLYRRAGDMARQAGFADVLAEAEDRQESLSAGPS